MANEIRARFNLVSGTLSGTLTNVATSMSSAGLSNLGVIDTTNYAAITIENEIVWVTAHTAAASTATILRAQEGTAAAAHGLVAWQHGPTVLDLSTVWKPPSCRLTQSGNISLADAAFTLITWNGETFDTDNMHDLAVNTGRITVNTAGVYMVTFQFRHIADATEAWSEGRIKLNGTTYLASAAPNLAGAAFQASGNVTTPYKASVGDYFEAVVFHDNTANVAVNFLGADANGPSSFAAIWVGLGV